MRPLLSLFDLFITGKELRFEVTNVVLHCCQRLQVLNAPHEGAPYSRDAVVMEIMNVLWKLYEMT